MTLTFKDDHPELQELFRQFYEHPEPLSAAGFPVLFAFMDKFLRLVLDRANSPPPRGASTKELLERCCSAKTSLLSIPGYCCKFRGIQVVSNMRAAVMHADYTKDMAELNEGNWSGTEAEYVKQILPSRLRTLYFTFNNLVSQIDRDSGAPVSKATDAVAQCNLCKAVPAKQPR